MATSILMIDIAFNIAVLTILFILAKHYRHKRELSILLRAGYIVVASILWACANHVDLAWVNLFGPAFAHVGLLLSLFRDEVMRRVGHGLVTAIRYIGCNALTHFILWYGFGAMHLSLPEPVAFAIDSLLTLVLFGISGLALLLFTNSREPKIRPYISLNTIYMLVATLFIGVYITQVEHLQGSMDPPSLMGLGCFFMVIVGDLLIIIGNEQGYSQLKKEQEATTLQLQTEHFRRLFSWQNAQWKKVAAKNHDFRHQLQIIQALLENGGGEDTIKRHAEKSLAAIKASLDDTLHFGAVQSRPLQMILEYMRATCEGYGIRFEANIAYSTFEFIDLEDICSLFMNAFENALEACKHVNPTEKTISLFIHRQDEIVFVKIENSKKNEIVEGADGIITSKNERDFHGYGMMNMRYIAEKYGGNMVYEYDDVK
ncbi:MAG: ATP-binding protein, partial [Clostridium sp.]|nr:ATP-binding protein [Clostridium sp.]